MRIALDTNILVYAEGVGDERRQHATHRLLAALPEHLVVLPAQTLGELFRVLTGKAKRPAAEAREAVLGWVDAFAVVDSTQADFLSAMDLAVDHGLQIWDGLILSVAAESRCRLLLSEDLQHGFTWRGVTVLNPYTDEPHPLLGRALEQR